MLCHKCNILLGHLESIDFNVEPYRDYLQNDERPTAISTAGRPKAAGETASQR